MKKNVDDIGRKLKLVKLGKGTLKWDFKRVKNPFRTASVQLYMDLDETFITSARKHENKLQPFYVVFCDM